MTKILRVLLPDQKHRLDKVGRGGLCRHEGCDCTRDKGMLYDQNEPALTSQTDAEAGGVRFLYQPEKSKLLGLAPGLYRLESPAFTTVLEEQDLTLLPKEQRVKV